MDTGSAETTDADGTYAYLVPGQPAPELLTVTWAGQYQGSDYTLTTRAEVTGAQLFSIPELRLRHTALSRTDKFPTDRLVGVREYVESRFAHITGRRFVPCLGVDKDLAGTGTSVLWLSRPDWLEILSVDESGTDITDQLTFSHDQDGGAYALSIYNPDITSWAAQSAWDPAARYEVAYIYGCESVPFPIATAAMSYAAYLAESENSSMDPRTTAVQLPNFGEPGRGAVINLTDPDPASERFTGIPEIDAVLWEYRLFWGVG